MASQKASAVEVAPRGTISDLWRRFRKNRLGLLGMGVVLALAVVALLAPLIAPYGPNGQNYGELLQPPGAGHWMGTDELGRDVLSRVLYGARISLLAGAISVAVALGFGLPIGLCSGYYRGFLDEVIVMRLTDAMQAFPFLILALALAAAFGPGFINAMVAVGIGFTPGFIRVVRAQVLAQREQDYVQAARAMGATDLRIMFLHILPNSLAPILVQASLAMAAAVIFEAGLSYLGLGTQPPTPSWGSMLKIAQGYLVQASWMAVWPGVAIFIAVMGFNLLGDGIRDMMDPRSRGDGS